MGNVTDVLRSNTEKLLSATAIVNKKTNGNTKTNLRGTAKSDADRSEDKFRNHEIRV